MVPARAMVSPSRPIWTRPAKPGFELQKGSSRSFGYTGRYREAVPVMNSL